MPPKLDGETMVTATTANDPQTELLSSLVVARTSLKYHDLIIRCRDREWKAHRVIVCLRSKFFDKACNGAFKESKTGEVLLEDDEPDIVDRMLDYLYRLDYDDQTESYPRALEGRLTVNARMYALADKYEIWALKELAKQKSIKALETDWKEGSFLSALQLVWTTTPYSDRGLRDCYLPVITAHKMDLHNRERFMELVRTVEDFGLDIVDMEWKRAARPVALPAPVIMRMLFCNSCRRKTSIQCYDCGQEGDFSVAQL